MTDQQKAQAVATIESDVMSMSTWEWIGDVLLAHSTPRQADGESGWVVFFPDGKSSEFDSEDAAREIACKRASPTTYGVDICCVANLLAERDALGTPTHQQVWEAATALPETTVWVRAYDEESVCDIYRSAQPLALDDALLVTPDGFAAASQEDADRIIAEIAAK